jgi:hypothetical protein
MDWSHGFKLKRGTGRGTENPQALVAEARGVTLCPSAGTLPTEPPLLIPPWDQSMGSSGFTALGLTVGGSPELPNP